MPGRPVWGWTRGSGCAGARQGGCTTCCETRTRRGCARRCGAAVVRDADRARLRAWVGGGDPEGPGGVLHGPAAAARLAEEGVTDEPLLTAVAWHTLGHPDLDLRGRCLYIADYIEPGRTYDPA